MFYLVTFKAVMCTFMATLVLIYADTTPCVRELVDSRQPYKRKACNLPNATFVDI